MWSSPATNNGNQLSWIFIPIINGCNFVLDTIWQSPKLATSDCERAATWQLMATTFPLSQLVGQPFSWLGKHLWGGLESFWSDPRFQVTSCHWQPEGWRTCRSWGGWLTRLWGWRHWLASAICLSRSSSLLSPGLTSISETLQMSETKFHQAGPRAHNWKQTE